MAFIYNIKLNGEVIDNIELGFTYVEDLEEALDSGSITLIIKDLDIPFEPNSLLSIEIDETSDFDSDMILNSKRIESLVISDNIEPMSQLESYYRHKLTLIEYTSKFDNYLMNNLSFTNRSVERKKAKFKYNNYHEPSDTNNVYSTNSGIENGTYKAVVRKLISIEKLEILYSRYFKGEEIYFNKKSVANFKQGNVELSPPVILKVKKDGVLIDTHYLSDSGYNLELEVGKYVIEYGVDIPLLSEFPDYAYGEWILYEYMFEVLPKETNTMFEIIEQVRETISKFGGIESRLFYEQTRLFELNEQDIEFLKTIEAPQIFLQTATVRQILIFILSYVNALPRVKRGFNIDKLELEFYGDSFKGLNDEFENVTSFISGQDNSQLGSRSYSAFKNILPNDLNEPTTFIPTQDGFYNVRAENIQLTDTNFELKLPKGKKLYKPVKLESVINKNARVYWGVEEEYINIDKIDLTHLLIIEDEWRLKQNTTNFPKVFSSKIGSNTVGLAEYKTENLLWKMGDESIKLSDIFGTMFKSNLIQSVITYALNEYFTERQDLLDNGLDYNIDLPLYDNPTKDDALWFKNLKFNFEYITSEEINLKQDKEDLSQVSFYSEMRQNQEESTISLSRVSNNTYGNLQRTGNKNFSFRKVHTTLSGMYQKGQKDKQGYVITKIASEYYNTHIDRTYFVTKDHNRISQATFIDQTYRKFDNYAQQLSNRHETYNDYVMLIPKDEKSLITPTITKMQENITTNGKKIPHKILFGVMGINLPSGQTGYKLIGKTKATTALVRTDGFLEEYKDENFSVNDVIKNYIIAPITSAGFRQGLVFKFGFEDNQVAGDMLVGKYDSELGKTNYFNQALRYTNNRGRFKYLDFNILNKINTYNDELDQYPLKKSTSDYASDTKTYNDGIISYFNTKTIKENQVGLDALIVNKDTMTNFKLSYALNILSYHYEKYIFGEKFYKNNHLVYNKRIEDKTYLYFYDDSFRYNIFENIKIKDGFIGERILNEGYIDIDDDLDIVNNHYLAKGHTWAIGDEDGNLIFVNNGGGSNIGVVKTHFRPNVVEIGSVIDPKIYYFDLIDKQELYLNEGQVEIGEVIHFEIIDKQELIINSGVIFVQDTYVFDLIDKQELSLNVGIANIQKTYTFSVLDSQTITINSGSKYVQRSYKFDMLDKQSIYLNSGSKYVQKSYKFDMLDKQEINIGLGSNYVQRSYKFDMLDKQEINIGLGSNYVQRSYKFDILDKQELYLGLGTNYVQKDYSFSLLDKQELLLNGGLLGRATYEQASIISATMYDIYGGDLVVEFLIKNNDEYTAEIKINDDLTGISVQGGQTRYALVDYQSNEYTVDSGNRTIVLDVKLVSSGIYKDDSEPKYYLNYIINY